MTDNKSKCPFYTVFYSPAIYIHVLKYGCFKGTVGGIAGDALFIEWK